LFFIPGETLGAFALTCLVIELTPGPNMAYLAVLSAGNGRRAGFAATMGIALGLLIVGIGAALGLAALISSSNLLYEALRLGGIVYLLWLAWDGWRDAAETSPARTVGSPGDGATTGAQARAPEYAKAVLLPPKLLLVDYREAPVFSPPPVNLFTGDVDVSSEEPARASIKGISWYRNRTGRS